MQKRTQVFDQQECQSPTLTLHSLLSDILTLVVNTTLMDGNKNKQKKYDISVSPDTDIGALKTHLHPIIDIPPAMMKVIFSF